MFWNIQTYAQSNINKQRKANLQEKKKSLFLVNLTEQERSQGQTWGETEVTVGRKQKTNKTLLYAFISLPNNWQTVFPPNTVSENHYRWWWNHMRLERFSPLQENNNNTINRSKENFKLATCPTANTVTFIHSPSFLTTQSTTNRYPLSLPA